MAFVREVRAEEGEEEEEGGGEEEDGDHCCLESAGLALGALDDAGWAAAFAKLGFGTG